jgi:hypothetical protein
VGSGYAQSVIWGIVYGTLAVGTLAVLVLPGVQIMKQVRALSKTVADSSSLIGGALADLERVSGPASHRDHRERSLVNETDVVEDGTAGTYHPGGSGPFRHQRSRSSRGS